MIQSHCSPRVPLSQLLTLMLIGSVVCILAPQAGEAAAPTVTRLTPAGLTIGTSQQIKIDGKIPDNASVWCSRSSLNPVLDVKSSAVTLEASESELPGVAHLRFFNAEGTTEPIPFVVSRLPQAVEVEPNNEIGTATELPVDHVVTGVLGKSGDVDSFKLSPAAGTTLVIEVDAFRTFGSPMDAIIQVTSQSGSVLAQEDDTINTDPRLIYKVPDDQPIYVRIFAFPSTPNSTIGFAGGSNFAYQLTATTQPFLSNAVPAAVDRQIFDEVAEDQSAKAKLNPKGWNLGETADAEFDVERISDKLASISSSKFVNHRLVAIVSNELSKEPETAPEDPSRVEMPIAIAGAFTAEDQIDRYTVELTKGETVRVSCRALELDSFADPVVEVLSPGGSVLKVADDISKTNRDATTEVKAAEDGLHQIRILERFGDSGPDYQYLLEIARPSPTFTASIKASSFTVPKDKALEIKIALSRAGGSDETWIIAAEGLPESIAVKETRAGAKGKTAILRLTASDSFQGPFRISARPENDESRKVWISTTLNGHRQQTRDLWLTANPDAK